MKAPLAAIVLLAGCSSIPAGNDLARAMAPELATMRGGPAAGRIAIAPLATFTLAGDETAKGWSRAGSVALDSEAVRRSVSAALAATEAFEGTRLAEGDALADAWNHREDYLLEVAISKLRTRFLGHNGWWIPNIVNFFLNTPFLAWWVATEEYSLELSVSFKVSSVQSGVALASGSFPVAVEGTFDEFDRGWQFFGPITSSLDGEGWQGIAEKLFPAARTELAAKVGTRAASALREARAAPLARQREAKTLAVVVGITRYEDPRAFPPLPSAADDALAFAAALRGQGALPQHVRVLLDRAATAAAVTSAVVEQAARAGEGDRLVVYFAGYGTRTANGRPALLLEEAEARDDLGLVSLDALARLIGATPGEKLVVVDAAFDGGSRSIASPTGARDDARPGVSLLLASGTNEAALAPEHLGHGLLTYRLIEALKRERDGIPLRELFPQVEAAVLADAELLGTRQVPRLEGPGSFSFLAPR